MAKVMDEATTQAQKGLTVLKVDQENHDTASLYLTGPDIEKFKNRNAGQFATIRVFRDGQWSEPHPFTLSSAPEDDSLRMTIKQSGTFTSTVPELAPGTPVQCSGPYGQFCRGIDEKHEIVMIAGGVGITPFLSVLRHFRQTKSTNSVLLLWANKTLDDAFAAKELEELTSILDLCVVHVLSRVKPEDVGTAPEFADGRPGCVKFEFGHIDHELLMRHIRSKSAAFYLCGPPAMQNAVLAALDKCGIAPGQIEKEAFVFNKPAA